MVETRESGRASKEASEGLGEVSMVGGGRERGQVGASGKGGDFNGRSVWGRSGRSASKVTTSFCASPAKGRRQMSWDGGRAAGGSKLASS